MQQLLQAIITTWKSNAGANQPLLGVWGPFWDLAPEKLSVGGNNTNVGYPRCVLRQSSAPKPIWGFGGGIYAEYVGIQFVIYASSADTGLTGLMQAANLSDQVTTIYDNNRLSLGGGEYCNLARRTGPVVLRKEPYYGGDGLAVYSATISYEYACQRTQ